MKKYAYMLAISLCLGVVACGDDKEDNVVPPATNNTQQGSTSQSLPDPEGTVIARITNDGVPENGINFQGSYVYMDRVYNVCVKKGNNSWTSSASITDLGKVAGLSAITKVPQEGYSDKVATSEGDGLILKLSLIQQVYIPYQGTSYIYPNSYYRIYIAEYIHDALGNIIGATIKYQTSTDWVEKDEE